MGKALQTSEESCEPQRRSPLSRRAIRSQLERILDHPEFKATERMRNLLSHVVNETLAGNAAQLKGYTIATDVFGRGADFDSARDPVVRVQAGRLRRALERYYLVAGADDPVRIDIPKGCYVAVFSSGPAEVDSDAGTSGVAAQPGVADWPSVLVRPLGDCTNDPELVYLASGLATELAIELGNCGDLRVMLSDDAAQRDGATGSAPDFVVQGSVFAGGSTVKVVVQLLSARTGEQLWVDAVKAPLQEIDLLSFQENAAAAIAAQIGSAHGIIFRALSAVPEQSSAPLTGSYQAILKGYDYQLKLDGESYGTALAALRQAHAADPACGLVSTMLALMYIDNIALEFFDVARTPLDETLQLAQDGAHQLPGNQMSRLVLARAWMLADELEAARREVNAALALHPDSILFKDAMGYLLVLLGDWERGARLANEAIRENPFYRRFLRYALWLDHFREGHYEEALAEAQALDGIGYFWSPLSRAATLGLLGRVDESENAVREILDLKPDFADRGHVLIGHCVKFPEIRERLIEGLAVGGLSVAADSANG
jgi:adenylate cyclase